MDWNVYNLKEVVDLKEEAAKLCRSNYPYENKTVNDVCFAAMETLDLV